MDATDSITKGDITLLRKLLALTCSLVLCCLGVVSANALTLTDGAEVKNRFGTNPRNIKDIGDPHILKAGDEYFTFATGGPLGFNVWRSADLNTFSKEKALKKIDWVSGDYWAPEVYEVGGKYYMFFTGRWKENQSLRIGVAVADAPQGPYTDAIGGPLFDFGYAAIDGTLLFDDAGTPYMIYSRDCSENVVGMYHESHLYGVQLAADLLSTVGEAVLLTKPDAPWELMSGDYHWNEGPAVLKHEGKYYLFYSANFYAGKEYTLGVAVADHPMGPYVKQANNPILNYIEKPEKVIVSGPGHNSFFTVGDEIFTSYHTHTYPTAPSGNRQVNIDRVGFHADGTAYINGPTMAKQLLPLSDLGLVNHVKTAATEAALLTDGDTCQAASSAAYVYAGKEATFTWDAPVTADMLLVYPALDQAITGTVTINGTHTAEFSYSPEERKPGGYALLTFEPIEVASLSLTFDCAEGVGEVMLVGTGK